MVYSYRFLSTIYKLVELYITDIDTPVSSTNKIDHNDITEILLKVALNTINQTIRQGGPKRSCLKTYKFYCFYLILPLDILQ
jgi:hypothetical protein